MLGIIILNYKKWEETYECLKSIYNQSIGEDNIKICVVDNNSSVEMPDNLKQLIQDHAISTSVIYLRNNYGYAYGNNRGIEYLIRLFDLDVICISNSDIIFTPDSLKSIVEFYKTYSGVSFPKILGPNNSVSYVDSKYYTTLKQMYRRFIMGKKYDQLPNAIDVSSSIPIKTHLNMGPCFCLDNKAATVLLPLDEHTTLYYEEMILSYNADKNGIPIYYNPTSVVIHKEGQSTGIGNPFAAMCRDESAMYYARTIIGGSKVATLPLLAMMCSKYIVKVIIRSQYRDYFFRYMKRITHAWRKMRN